MNRTCEDSGDTWQPCVSVVIPAYNDAKLAPLAVKSALRQDYERLELLVIDDASEDKTYDVLRILNDEVGGAFRIRRHARNQGLAATLNEGLLGSRGEFVLLLHQDCELVETDWISRALLHFADDRIVVVTARSILAEEPPSLVQKAYAVLSKRIQQDANTGVEEITFFEGKCDLCMKEALLSQRGFMSGSYGISGQDQMASHAFRKAGKKIVRDNSLHFVQRYYSVGTLHEFLRKEFLFGKTQAGITAAYGFYQFRGIGKSPYMRSRALYRASKPVFVGGILLMTIVYLALGVVYLQYLTVLAVAARLFCFSLDYYRNPVKHALLESIAISLIGIATDFAYALGFAWGAIMSSIWRKQGS